MTARRDLPPRVRAILLVMDAVSVLEPHVDRDADPGPTEGGALFYLLVGLERMSENACARMTDDETRELAAFARARGA